MIALFDSGYGGLTVLKPIMDLLPEYDYLYLGDNGRAPYGNHSPETIRKFSEEAVEYLFKRGAKLIIFACNTASSMALRHIQQKYLNGSKEKERAVANAQRANNLASPVVSEASLSEKDRKILGVLIPAAEEAVKLTKGGRIGVIGTRATVDSKVYEKEIAKLNPKIKVYAQACPLLVPLIEENWHKKPEAISILKKYLRPMKSYNLDTLILGCTHYPLMLKDIRRIMGKKVRVLHSGEVTAKSLKNYLQRHPEIESKLSKKKNRTFLTTDDPQKFKEFTEQHFGIKIKMPEKVQLG